MKVVITILNFADGPLVSTKPPVSYQILYYSFMCFVASYWVEKIPDLRMWGIWLVALIVILICIPRLRFLGLAILFFGTVLLIAQQIPGLLEVTMVLGICISLGTIAWLAVYWIFKQLFRGNSRIRR